MLERKIVVIGGGTISHVRSHLALCAPAYGGSARKIDQYLREELGRIPQATIGTKLILTKMADSSSDIETNRDVSDLVDRLIDDPATAGIIFSAALADFDGQIGWTESGKYADRLQSREGPFSMELHAADKVIGRIHKKRPSIVVAGFKTTSGSDFDEQVAKGNRLLEESGAHVVLANDIRTRRNVTIHSGGVISHTDRDLALRSIAVRVLTGVRTANWDF